MENFHERGVWKKTGYGSDLEKNYVSGSGLSWEIGSGSESLSFLHLNLGKSSIRIVDLRDVTDVGDYKIR